jgi:hypothetical protein
MKYDNDALSIVIDAVRIVFGTHSVDFPNSLFRFMARLLSTPGAKQRTRMR